MNWNETLQTIIDYVEQHLQRFEKPIDYDEIARIAGCSFSFFQKVFSYMNGISFSDYVRSRKLTLAGYELKSTNKKVIEISYQYGYDSPTSFTKAFQQFHGVTPKEARRQEGELTVVPKMQITHSQQFAWRLEEKPALHLVGVKKMMSLNHVSKQIEEFWNDCKCNGVFANLLRMDEGSPQGMFGLFTGYDEVQNEVEYAIMVNSQCGVGEEFEKLLLPAETWAVFDCIGSIPKAIQNGWQFLQEEWLLKYPFKHASSPELEWYSNDNPYDEEYKSQIWIPVMVEK